MRVLGICALIIVGLIMFLFATFMIGGMIADKREYPSGLTMIEAGYGCEQAIKARSVNPTTVKIGDPKKSREVEYAIFSWGPAELQMQNRFGAMLGVSAVCKVNLKTRGLVYLDLK